MHNLKQNFHNNIWIRLGKLMFQISADEDVVVARAIVFYLEERLRSFYLCQRNLFCSDTVFITYGVIRSTSRCPKPDILWSWHPFSSRWFTQNPLLSPCGLSWTNIFIYLSFFPPDSLQTIIFWNRIVLLTSSKCSTIQYLLSKNFLL